MVDQLSSKNAGNAIVYYKRKYFFLFQACNNSPFYLTLVAGNTKEQKSFKVKQKEKFLLFEVKVKPKVE
jgi:hypothetical protein